MRKVTILLVLAIVMGVIFIGCDQQKAIDQILQKPEMKQYIMTKMMTDEGVKEEITAGVLADTAWVNLIMGEYAKQMSNREKMMNTLLSYPGMGEIMLTKMAEDENLKKSMKEISGRRR